MNSYAIKGDMHTHTLVSQHAFGTLKEMIEASKAKNLDFIAITDHGPEMTDGANRLHFIGLGNLPDFIDGIRLYKGIEANIKSYAGRLDLENSLLRRLDYVIASFHKEAIKPGTAEENTEAWLSVIRKKHVDALGHMGNPAFPFDHRTVMLALRDSGKVFEINSHSPVARPGSEENCLDLIKYAKKWDIPVVCTSDAHSPYSVGEVKYSLDLLKSQDFPSDLILNSSLERMDSYIERRRKEKKADSTTGL